MLSILTDAQCKETILILSGGLKELSAGAACVTVRIGRIPKEAKGLRDR